MPETNKSTVPELEKLLEGRQSWLIARDMMDPVTRKPYQGAVQPIVRAAPTPAKAAKKPAAKKAAKKADKDTAPKPPPRTVGGYKRRDIEVFAPHRLRAFDAGTLTLETLERDLRALN